MLNLLVLRTAHMDAMLAFYRALGLEFTQEQHGSGPVHYACERDGMVMELYPGEPGAAPDRKSGGATMLGFLVNDVDAVVATLEQAGISAISAPKDTAWGRRALVLDPDGRAVELVTRN
jgi:catechol 2,3-dioxygenase-like lactoylglutathione lyase family enzyme